MSVLKQDQFQYDAYTVLDTVYMGNQKLYDIGKQKDASTKRRISPMRTGFWPLSWKPNLPSWAAGKRNLMRHSC